MTTAEQLKKLGFDQGIQQGVKQGIQQGVKQGVKQGIGRGRAETILALCKAKFGALSETEMAAVRQADAAALDKMTGRILTAETFGELFDT